MKTIANIEENTSDPIAPEIVLLGLIFVNFGPLRILPNTKPPISDATQNNKIKKINTFIDNEKEKVSNIALK